MADKKEPAAAAATAETTATVSSLPSGKPIESSSEAAAAPSPPSKRTFPPPSLGALLQSAPSRADAFLAHLHRCASTRAGADTILFFLTYLTRLSGNILETASRAALRNSANKLVALALQLPPATAVSFVSESPRRVASPIVSLALQLAARLKAAAATLGEIRTFGRLWGLLGLYFAGKKLLQSRQAAVAFDGDEKNKSDMGSSSSFERQFDFFVRLAQIIALVNWQATENVAYLASRKIVGVAPATQARLGRWSVRSWALYTGMELGRLLIERQRRVSRSGGAQVKAEAEYLKWQDGWKTEFMRTLAWWPITVHYSVGDGMLSDMGISALAFIPAVSQMRETWNATA